MATSSAFPDFAEFLAEVASITAELLGADRVDLRSIDVLPRSEQYVVGSAYIQSGHMEVGHDVPRFIERLLASRDRPLTAGELDALRDALGTFLHESIHLALPNDYNPGLALHSLEVPAEVFLEEGVTEAATHALLPQLLAWLERVFPGVSREVPDLSGYYPNYVPATQELLKVVSGLPEMQGRDALRELARVAPEQKFDLLVEQAMEGFGLTFNVPARDRREVRSRIRAALEAQVERNYDWMVPPDPDRPGKLNTREAPALSTIMGRQMGMELLRQLHAEGERVGMELPAGWRDMLAERELKTADQLLGQGGFAGPDADQALKDWIRTVQSERHKSESTRFSPRQDWLRAAKGNRRRTPWVPYKHAARGITR